MIEVQDERIGLAAIDTWMVQQKLEQTAQILGDIDGVVALGGGDVRGAITFVVGPVPRLVARAAEAVEASCRAILEG